VDRALEFHEVDCRLWRFEEGEAASGAGRPASTPGHRLAKVAKDRWRRAAATLEGALLPAGLAAG
jgi:hypothetical protein